MLHVASFLKIFYSCSHRDNAVELWACPNPQCYFTFGPPNKKFHYNEQNEHISARHQNSVHVIVRCWTGDSNTSYITYIL